MLRILSIALALASPVAAENHTLDPELVTAGEKIFRKCKACHQIGPNAGNRTGPALNEIVGAPAGQVEGYRYSKVLRAAAEDGLVWTPAELTEFLASPKGYLKGNKMKFPGLRRPADIKAVIAYLASSKG